MDSLNEFRSSAVPHPETLTERAEATSALRTLYVQGWLTTPSPCYGLDGEYGRKGRRLTLRVWAQPVEGTDCNSGPGGFQYTAVILGLDRRTYHLDVIHDVSGGQRREFNLQVTVVD